MIKQLFLTVALLLGILFLPIGCTNPQNSTKMTEKSTPTIIEMTSFQLIEGVEEADFIKAAKVMQKGFLNQQDGFISRNLVKGENEWTDVVFWKDPQSIERAMKNAETSEKAAPFMRMIDFNSVKMNISEIKL